MREEIPRWRLSTDLISYFKGGSHTRRRLFIRKGLKRLE